MTEELLLLLVREASKLFFDYVVSESLENGITANANTDASYNTYVSGEFSYVWWENSTTSETRTMPFTLSSGMDDIAFVGDVSSIQWRGGVYDTTPPAITVTENNGDIVINTSAQMYLYINGRLIEQNYITNSCKISTQYTANYGYANGDDLAIFWPAVPQFGGTVIGKLNGVNATSEPEISQTYPDAVYVPAPSDGTINYNEYTYYIVDWANNTYPQYNITINDVPTWDELESETETEQETTETEIQGCSLNYDEILGEDELESILNQETYQIPELETEFFTSPTEIILDSGELLGELESVPDFIKDGVKSTWDILNIWGISGIFTGCATVAVIWAIIKNK